MTKDEALKLTLYGITKVPTWTHGVLVKLSDVEAAITALAQPEQHHFANGGKVIWVELDAADKDISNLIEDGVCEDWIDGYLSGLKDGEKILKDKNT